MEPAVRDSAGVTIVEYPRSTRALPLDWVVATAPELVVGGFDAPEGADLWGVAGYSLLPDSSLAVLSSGHKSVRVFGADGRLLRSIGRGGQGPGELELYPPSGSLDFLPPDTLLVLHGRGIETFLTDGTFVASTRVPATPDALGPGQSARPLKLGPDRGMVGVGSAARWDAPASGPFRPPHAWVAYPGPAEAPVLLEWVDGITQERVDVGNRHTIVVPPFPSYPGVTRGRSADAAWVTFDTGRYGFDVYDGSGRLRLVVRWDVEPVPVRSEWVDAWKDDQRRRTRDRQGLPALERAWAKMAIPRTLPPIDGVAVDALGFVWIRRTTTLPTGAPDYDVFDPHGRLVGRVRLPAGLRHQTQEPLIGEDFLVGVWVDGFGAESVRRYALDRGAGVR